MNSSNLLCRICRTVPTVTLRLGHLGTLLQALRRTTLDWTDRLSASRERTNGVVGSSAVGFLHLVLVRDRLTACVTESRP